MAELNITNIPAPRVPFIDERTGLMAREWYRFFLNLFVLTGSGNNPITLEELQLGPPNQPDLTELLIQINQNIAPQYEDQSGDFLATLDTAQLMSMMSRFENAEAAIQGAYLQPVVQTGTIANYNLDGSPTAGGIAYGTGPALAVSAAGTIGQVLTSGGAGAPTWATDAGGSVTSVSVVSANGLAGTVATATTTPAITLSTTVTGVVKGNGTALSAAVAATDYVAPSAYASANGLTMATARLLGRTTASTGAAEEISVAGGLTLSAGTLTGASGTVTSVTGTAPVVSSGGATPAISMAAATTSVNGYLTSTDWTTFNNKGSGTVTSVAALTLGTTGTDLSSTVANGTTTPVITLQVPTASATNRGALSAADWTTFNSKGSGTVTSVTGTAPVVSSGGATPVISMAAATTSVDGYLTSTDWTTFNSKQPAGSYLVSGGALGTPSSGTVTNLTGTASININGTVGATTPTTGAFTTMKASTGAAVGGATPGAGGIAFPATAVAVADANTLDDYEEGTWTPVFTDITGSPTGIARYVKIGSQVTLTFEQTGGAFTCTGGSGYITGIPFAGIGGSGVVSACGAISNTVVTSVLALYNASTTGAMYVTATFAAAGGVGFTITYFV